MNVMPSQKPDTQFDSKKPSANRSRMSGAWIAPDVIPVQSLELSHKATVVTKIELGVNPR